MCTCMSDKHVDNVSRHTHPYIQKYSDFLAWVIHFMWGLLRLAPAHPNYGLTTLILVALALHRYIYINLSGKFFIWQSLPNSPNCQIKNLNDVICVPTSRHTLNNFSMPHPHLCTWVINNVIRVPTSRHTLNNFFMPHPHLCTWVIATLDHYDTV